MTAHGAFHWNELMSHDVEKARDFYAKTLGWTFKDMPMPEMDATYTLIKSGDHMVGGMFPMAGADFANLPDHWFTYVAVDDVDKRLNMLKDAGGKVHREPWDIPGIGRIAIVEIPGGAEQGWMTPSEGVTA
jgi:predicted enzyme related to lactoylglutathione lyase